MVTLAIAFIRSKEISNGIAPQKMRPHFKIGKSEGAHVVAIRKQGGNPCVQQPTALTCHILR